MNSVDTITLDPANEWRVETPGSTGWQGSPRPGSDKKYFMISADTHMTPPISMMRERIEPEYRDRLARIERREDGTLWSIVEGSKPFRLVDSELEGEDQYRAKSGAVGALDDYSADMEKRFADLEADGIDAELVFPNGPALTAFWTKDAAFSQAQFRVYNDWAAEVSKPIGDKLNMAACVATADIESAIIEINRVAALGFRVITVPTKPIFGPATRGDLNYNSPEYDPMWAAIEEADLTITYHVSTGQDPRTARGPGGAVINMAIHSLSTTAEPLANMCASGLLDRFPRLRFSVVESGCGWIPWLLDTMDEAYRKHHMWVKPKLKHGLPSEYFREHGAATFGEDVAGLALAERYGLTDNFCFANDYPHHEGTFPHSAEAIERTMGELSETNRRKILGLNAARIFRFEIPDRYR